jgi:hypothetical protein
MECEEMSLEDLERVMCEKRGQVKESARMSSVKKKRSDKT